MPEPNIKTRTVEFKVTVRRVNAEIPIASIQSYISSAETEIRGAISRTLGSEIEIDATVTL